MSNLFNYSKALELIKNDKKVSCLRWGNEGKVYVRKTNIVDEFEQNFPALILVDTNRTTTVMFTPSVENQLQDEWYEVE